MYSKIVDLMQFVNIKYAMYGHTATHASINFKHTTNRFIGILGFCKIRQRREILMPWNEA